MSFLKKVQLFFNLYRGAVAYLLCKLSRNRSVIFADLERWKEVHNLKGKFLALTILLMNCKEYRNLLCYRLRGFSKLIFLLHYKRMDTLVIGCTSIGKGLFIHHGIATIISAKSIGDNCWINQQVTIGYKGDGQPTLGNNVTVCAGALVLGDIHLGDNCVVGAGAVVVNDVPPGTTVVGVPARPISKE